MRRGWLLSSGNDGNWEGEGGEEKEVPLLTYLLLSASQNSIQENRLSTQLVSPQMSDGSEQAP